MQVNEFIQVLNYIEKSITESELPARYQELNQILSQLRSAPTPEVSQQFNEKKHKLFNYKQI